MTNNSLQSMIAQCKAVSAIKRGKRAFGWNRDRVTIALSILALAAIAILTLAIASLP